MTDNQNRDKDRRPRRQAQLLALELRPRNIRHRDLRDAVALADGAAALLGVHSEAARLDVTEKGKVAQRGASGYDPVEGLPIDPVHVGGGIDAIIIGDP